MSDLLTALGLLLGAVLFGWFAKGKKMAQDRKIERERNKKIRAEAEKEAESQDDQALIDRITRRGGP